MLIARRTPLTSTLARSGWSGRISTISPGIPRHIPRSLVRYLDGFEHQFVAAGQVEVAASAGGADGERVEGLPS